MPGSSPEKRDRKAWFAPKRYGYGAGLPITWQGWAVMTLFFAAFIAVHFLFTGIARWSLSALAVVVLAGLCAAKTEGGWRWRWGDRR